MSDLLVDLLAQFDQALAKEGKSKKTITSYTGDVRMFLEWISTKTTFKGALSRFHVTSYKQHLLDGDYTINTINKKLNSLHAFNQFLITQKLCHERAVIPLKDKVKIARGSEGEVAVFSPEEVERILFYLERKDKVKVRDKLIFHILVYTGLRVSEVVNLKVKDIDLLTHTLAVIGKGGKYREVPLKPSLVDIIKDYQEDERKASKFRSSDYLLLTQRAGKMDRDTVNKVLNRHGDALGLDINPHKFRHTFCTRLLKKGVDLTTVAKLAGHSNIQTTASFYINTSRSDKVDAVNLL